MLIDWFTVGAQALNFVILVWLMKRFLYRPILEAIDAREKRISTGLADALAGQVRAQAACDDFQARKEAFDRQRADLLAQAAKDTKDETARLMTVAWKAADALAARQRRTLEEEALRLEDGIVARTRTAVFDIARETLAELADTALETSAVRVFVARLEQMQGDALASMARAVQAATGPVLVRSAFELPPAQRQAVEAAVQTRFGASPTLRFEVRPELVAGIELCAGGQKLAWTIAGRLARLRQFAEPVSEAAEPAETAGAAR